MYTYIFRYKEIERGGEREREREREREHPYTLRQSPKPFRSLSSLQGAEVFLGSNTFGSRFYVDALV